MCLFRLQSNGFIPLVCFLFMLLPSCNYISENLIDNIPDKLQTSFDISPDDSRILFSYRTGDRTGLYEADLNGQNIRLLAMPSHGFHYIRPVYSPDGSKIIFLNTNASGSHSNLAVMSRDGGELKTLTSGNNPVQEAIFARDGQTVYFIEASEYDPLSGMTRRYQIHSVRPDGTRHRQLTDFKNEEFPVFINLTLNRDGTRFLFSDLNRGLKTLPVSNPDKVSSFEPLNRLDSVLEVAVSPQTPWLAFIVSLPDNPEPTLLLLNERTREQKQISSSAAHPRFFHHRNRLLFMKVISTGERNTDILNELWLVDLQTGEEKPISLAPSEKGCRHCLHKPFSLMNGQQFISVTDPKKIIHQLSLQAIPITTSSLTSRYCRPSIGSPPGGQFLSEKMGCRLAPASSSGIVQSRSKRASLICAGG